MQKLTYEELAKQLKEEDLAIVRGTNLEIPTLLNSQEEAKTFAKELIEACIPDGLTPIDAVEAGKPAIPWNRLPGQVREIVHLEVQKRELKKMKDSQEQAKENAGKGFRTPTKCICGGTGWIGGLFPVGDKNFGKAFPCHCRLNQERYDEYLWSVAGISESTFQRFKNYEVRNDECKIAKDSAFTWASGDKSPWLMMLGNPGVGKTHLAKSAVSWIIGRKEMVAYTTSAELASKVKALINTNENDDYVSHLKNVPHLIIDDLGREYTTDYVRALFYEILDYRYSRRMRTMITSNFTLDELQEVFDHAVVDRFKDVMVSTLVVLGETESMRQEKREELPWE